MNKRKNSKTNKKNKKKQKIIYQFPLDEKINRNFDNWFSATSVKNHILGDPLVDFLEKYGKNFISNDDNKKIKLSNIDYEKIKNNELDEFTKLVFSKGNEFEKIVIEELEKKFDVVKILDNYKDYRNIEKVKQTYEEMKKGTPIIYQGLLYNDETDTFGIPDLIVRSDYINQIVETSILSEEEENIKADNLPEYHYRIIDIKWSVLKLRSDSVHLLNSERIPAYKSQLLIYMEALDKLQKYNPKKAYILGKSYEYTFKREYFSGNNCFDRLGVIDYDNLDKEYYHKTNLALKWLRELKKDGEKWNLLPPSREELYPNMNISNNKWQCVKKILANKIQDITSLWICGTVNREYAHKNGIYKWSDEKCNSENLGITGNKQAPILDKILQVNKSKDKIIIPESIENNTKNWQYKNNIEFFVDFETLHTVFVNDPSLINNEYEFCYMIGVGYYKKGKYSYKQFVAKNLTDKEEEKIFNSFYNFYKKQTNNKNANIYHWGHIEKSIFNKKNIKYGNKWDSIENNWVDFLTIFKSEPIAIKGALKFGLKDIANAMHENKMIKTKWEDNMDGLSSMIEAIKYYKNNDKKIINRIKNYNQIDCKVIYEIVNYLRINNCNNIVL